MNKKEKAKKDIETIFDFARYLMDNPKELNKIPSGSEISFHEKSDTIVVKPSAKHKRLNVEIKRNFEIKKVA